MSAPLNHDTNDNKPTPPQNQKGHLIGHVKEVVTKEVFSAKYNGTTRLYMTSMAQPWHVDASDLVGALLFGRLVLCRNLDALVPPAAARWSLYPWPCMISQFTHTPITLFC